MSTPPPLNNITILFMHMDHGETHQVVSVDGAAFTVFLNARCDYKTLKKAFDGVLERIASECDVPVFRQQFEDEYKNMRAQSKRYSKWAVSREEENERNLRIHKEHKADPDW